MVCSHQKQIRLLLINTNFCQIIFLVDSSFLFLVDSGNPSWIRGLLPGTNSLVFVPSKEYCVYFLLAFTTLVVIRVLTYPGLMANRWNGDHHNNDSDDNVNNPVLTRVEFLDFRDENQQFHDSNQQTLDQIQEVLATLLNRNPNRDDEERHDNRVNGPPHQGPNQNR